MRIEIEEYTISYLNLSWIWLNDPEIKMLTNTPNFTLEEQKIWFENLKSKTDYRIFGVSADKKPIGVCGIKNISLTDCEYWGYIGEKAYWGKGIGKIIIAEMEQLAQKMGLTSIWLKVIAQNERAQLLYTKMLYVEERRDENMLYMRKKLIKRS